MTIQIVRSNNGYTVRVGHADIRLTPEATKQLHNELSQALAPRHETKAVTPAKARLQRFVRGVEVFD